MRPLEGIRVLDLSRLVAGGVAGMLLADFGADVVKVEQPGTGDPLRQWTTNGQPLWWKVYGRNKRYITLNLKSDEGRALLERLVARFDVVMESFVPGTLVEAASGFAAMNGEPEGPPIVPAFPLADMTSALYAVNAIMFAIYDRDVHGGSGQIVDVALFESLFSVQVRFAGRAARSASTTTSCTSASSDSIAASSNVWKRLVSSETLGDPYE